jgi:hypothetical protein
MMRSDWGIILALCYGEIMFFGKINRCPFLLSDELEVYRYPTGPPHEQMAEDGRNRLLETENSTHVSVDLENPFF